MWKEAFRPTKKKLLFSVVAVIIWYLYLFSVSCLFSSIECIAAVFCPDQFPMIIPLCGYCCYQFGSFVGQLVYIIIVPFALVYILLSLNRLIQMRKGKK